eukprot:jgi/Picsp_1/1316/NSC_04797-R1_alpha beta-hydrolase
MASLVGHAKSYRQDGLETGTISNRKFSSHFDHKSDVICRMECLRDSTVKQMTFLANSTVLVSTGLLVAAVVIKAVKAPESLLENDKSLFIVNICIGSVCLMLLGITCCVFLHRVRCAIRSKKRWSSRRRRFVLMSGAELCIQTLNSVFYLVPNVAVMAKDCYWFSPLAGSQLPVRGKRSHNGNNNNNGVNENHIASSEGSLSAQVKRFIDMAFYHHWKPVVFVWLPTQAGVTGVSVTAQLDLPGKDRGCDPTRSSSYDCSLSTSAIVFGSFTVLMVGVYLVNYVVTLYRVFSSLYCVPYNQFRMANLVVRLQVRIRGFSFVFFAVTPIVYYFVRMNSCSSYAFSWLGMAPMQVVETVVALVQSMLSSPANPHTLAVLQVWLQEFAWKEDDVSDKRRERASSLPDESFEEVELNKEPLFCFETAVKMLYWANLVYYIDKNETNDNEAQERSKKFALDLYRLDHFDVVSSKNLDSKAIVGWKNDCIVISFRGTSSMVNVMSDVRVWRTPFPPDSTLNKFTSSSKVHSGFLAAYRAEGFNIRLLDSVKKLIDGCCENKTKNKDNVKVFVTGHSLGGALAVLCSFEIATTLSCSQRVDLHCYVFGSPRVGNHTWASLYNQHVPNTWQIINDDDTITRAGKFFFLYKHVGHRALINKKGDMLVRPSFSEYSMRRAPGGSIRDHYLTRYRRAMDAIVEAQFSGKSLGDVEKIEELKNDKKIQRILSKSHSNGLDE